MLELQRALFAQLTGRPLATHDDATPSTQRQQLQDAGAGKSWLIVLDDIWVPEHERMLNFLDPTELGSAVFVTTRFSKLLQGYTEVPLGLLTGTRLATSSSEFNARS